MRSTLSVHPTAAVRSPGLLFGPSVQQETHLFAPLLACPLDNPVPLVIVPHPYPNTATKIQSPDGGSCPLVPGRPSVSGSLHYAGCLQVQNKKLSNPSKEKERCPHGEMSNCSEQRSMGFPPSCTPGGYVHTGQPVLPPPDLSHWTLLPRAAELKPRAC